jgi:hypothetical protein
VTVTGEGNTVTLGEGSSIGSGSSLTLGSGVTLGTAEDMGSLPISGSLVVVAGNAAIGAGSSLEIAEDGSLEIETGATLTIAEGSNVTISNASNIKGNGSLVIGTKTAATPASVIPRAIPAEIKSILYINEDMNIAGISIEIMNDGAIFVQTGKTLTLTSDVTNEGRIILAPSAAVDGVSKVLDIVISFDGVEIEGDDFFYEAPRGEDALTITITKADLTLYGDHRTLTIDGLAEGDFLVIQYLMADGSTSFRTAEFITSDAEFVKELYYPSGATTIYVTVFSGQPDLDTEAPSLGVDIVGNGDSEAVDAE